MSYQALYAHCQGFEPHVRRNAVRDKAQELTGVERLSTVKTTLDATLCRGFYLSARNTQHRLVAQLGGHVIALARDLDPRWERFVYVKELMHLFDDPTEATDTGDQFETLLEEFVAPQQVRSLQMKSEIKSFWMALGVLCPESHRQRFMGERENGQIDDYAIALTLRIPELYIPTLFHPQFLPFCQSF